MENSHTYVCGKSGMGKSTFLQNEVFRDLDRPLFFIDPHGETVERIADCLPRSLIKRTVYIDLADPHYAVGFNPLAIPVLHQISGFKSVWHDSWGPQSEYLLRYALYAVTAYGGTLRDIIPLFTNQAHRDKVLDRVRSPDVRRFWKQTFPDEYETSKKEPYLPLINKIDTIVATPINRILCQLTPKLDFVEALNRKYIVLLNLSIPTVGDEAAAILGALFTTTLRATLLNHPTPCSLFADEFQKYGTAMYASMLSEMRKFGLRLLIGHQYISQVHDDLRAGILGNVRHKVLFCVDYEDAVLVGKSYNRLTQAFNPAAITELDPYYAFVDGVRTAMPRFEPPYGEGKLRRVTEHTRRHFARRLG